MKTLKQETPKFLSNRISVQKEEITAKCKCYFFQDLAIVSKDNFTKKKLFAVPLLFNGKNLKGVEKWGAIMKFLVAKVGELSNQTRPNNKAQSTTKIRFLKTRKIWKVAASP